MLCSSLVSLLPSGKRNSRWWWLGWVLSSYVSLRRLSEELHFSCEGARCAVRTWKLVHFRMASYLAVTLLVSGCCFWSAENWLLREILRLLWRNVWLDSDYMFCINWAFFERNAHIFYGEADSNTEVCCLRSHEEWRSVLSRYFSSQSLFALLAHGNLETTFMELTWLAAGVTMMGRVSALALAHVN